MISENYIITLSILIPLGIGLYIYALIRLKEQEKGIGLIGWSISKGETKQ